MFGTKKSWINERSFLQIVFSFIKSDHCALLKQYMMLLIILLQKGKIKCNITNRDKHRPPPPHQPVFFFLCINLKYVLSTWYSSHEISKYWGILKRKFYFLEEFYHFKFYIKFLWCTFPSEKEKSYKGGIKLYLYVYRISPFLSLWLL